MKKNKTFFSLGSCMGVALASILFIAVVASNSATASSMPRIAICSCYSDASFAYMAEQTSLSEAPWFEGIDPVYVLNPYTDEIRHFEVKRWFNDGSSSEAAGRDVASRTAMARGYFRAEAVPKAGDPDVIAEMLNGIGAVKSFAAQLDGGIPDDEFQFAYGSAVSLVGPEDSAAGYRRGALRNDLRAYLNAIWNEIKPTLDILAQHVAALLLSSESIDVVKNLTIEFSDGSSIRVEVVRIKYGVLDSNILFDFRLRTGTAYGPGLSAVPQSPGEFDGFGYEGNEMTTRQLVQLARQFDIPVAGSGGDEFHCVNDGQQIKCRVSGGQGAVAPAESGL